MNGVLAIGFPLVLCWILWMFATVMKKALGFRRLGLAATVVQMLALGVAVGGVIFALLPAIPCEPVRVSLGRSSRAAITVDTLNYALPYLTSFLLVVWSIAGFCLYCLTPAYRKDVTDGQGKRLHRKGRKKGAKREKTPAVLQNVSWSVRQKIILLTVFLLFLAFSALLIYEMITL